MKADDISPTFCILPWIHFATYPNGDVSTCCIATQMRDLNLTHYSLADVWNSDHFKKTRLDMLQGKQVERCDFCYRQEEANVDSRRMEENHQWFAHLTPQEINNLIQQTKPDGELAIKPSTMDLRPSNKCNLKCIMCDPAESSAWEDEALFLSENLNSDIKSFWKFNVKLADSTFNLFRTPRIMDEITELLPSTLQIILAGGEPFLLKEHDIFIEKIIKSGFSTKISLRYHTNGTVITARNFEQWKQFKHVHIMLSLDGPEKINNYIRFPSKWESLRKILTQLDQTPDNVDPQILTTISLLNFPYIIDFSVWLRQQNYKKIGIKADAGFFYPSILFWPKYLSITVLPPAVKEMLTSSINEYAQTIHPLQANRLLSIAGHMNSCDQSYLLPQTIEFLKKTDQNRNTDYTQLFSFLDI